MSDTVIKIENLSKLYRLGLVSTGTISHDLNRLWAKIRGKEDPFLKVGETNDRSVKGSSDYAWALKDINLEIKRGDRVGIIGRNGAGKSTLLKILSKVTGPTTGQIKIKGRIASLLEVGTGFQPELTGRENIYMNGTILGMKRWEVTKKLDEIVNFAGCERYIDTPVKRYSSGMKVRLGFAVAAHLEPDILVVDEVLAVGDAEFQKKAIGKMQEVSEGYGRTILFVSHNMAAIRALCPNTYIMDEGRLSFSGSTERAIETYLASDINQNTIPLYRKDEDRNMKGQIICVKVTNFSNKISSMYRFDENIKIKVVFRTLDTLSNSKISLRLQSMTYNVPVFKCREEEFEITDHIKYREKGFYIYETLIPKNTLGVGVYCLNIGFHENNLKLDLLKNICNFTIIDTSSKRAAKNIPWDGLTGFIPEWKIKKSNIFLDK
ncbi:MAG: ATP-binding cassette domain-containing protein [bacterium]|nr:ATP-binding cassette domain-containing protein [bacterium]